MSSHQTRRLTQHQLSQMLSSIVIGLLFSLDPWACTVSDVCTRLWYNLVCTLAVSSSHLFLGSLKYLIAKSGADGEGSL